MIEHERHSGANRFDVTLSGAGTALHDLEPCGNPACNTCWLFGDRADVIARAKAMAWQTFPKEPRAQRRPRPATPPSLTAPLAPDSDPEPIDKGFLRCRRCKAEWLSADCCEMREVAP